MFSLRRKLTHWFIEDDGKVKSWQVDVQKEILRFLRLSLRICITSLYVQRKQWVSTKICSYRMNLLHLTKSELIEPVGFWDVTPLILLYQL